MQRSKLRPPGGAKLRPLRRIACKFRHSDEQHSQNSISPSISLSSDNDICAESKPSKLRRFIAKSRDCAKKYAPVAKLALRGAAAASAACPPAQAAVAAVMVVADASEQFTSNRDESRWLASRAGDMLDSVRPADAACSTNGNLAIEHFTSTVQNVQAQMQIQGDRTAFSRIVNLEKDRSAIREGTRQLACADGDLQRSAVLEIRSRLIKVEAGQRVSQFGTHTLLASSRDAQEIIDALKKTFYLIATGLLFS
ncbi:hypothetical protein HWV62_42707 [Athelia sp. TMB]|nr:hypothetical protein HWV62_42707 [Athelia sp. TMB]